MVCEKISEAVPSRFLLPRRARQRRYELLDLLSRSRRKRVAGRVFSRGEPSSLSVRPRARRHPVRHIAELCDRSRLEPRVTEWGLLSGVSFSFLVVSTVLGEAGVEHDAANQLTRLAYTHGSEVSALLCDPSSFAFLRLLTATTWRAGIR